MRSSLKSLIKACLPPVLYGMYVNARKSDIQFLGNYPTMEDAKAQSLGYDADLILEKVSASLLQVKTGKAVYERDSVLFDKVDYSFPLLSTLLRAAVESNGQLNILDFGGSLGSSYFQCRGFLPVLSCLNWHVVEQANFVRRGRQLFESNELKFFDSIQDSLGAAKPDVILFASVLQYLDDPTMVLHMAIDTSATYLIIDRTPFSDSNQERVCVQHVPASIYQASYPCRILSQARLQNLLEPHFELLSDFDALGGKGKVMDGMKNFPFRYRGMIWRRRQANSLEQNNEI